MSAPLRIVQEHDELPLRRLLWLTLIALLIGAAAVGVSQLLAGATPQRRAVPSPSGSFTSTPEQSLIEHSERGLALRRAQREKLESFGWVDRDAGVVRVPIERAIELQAERER